jgi:hypothetical protein
MHFVKGLPRVLNVAFGGGERGDEVGRGGVI